MERRLGGGRRELGRAGDGTRQRHRHRDRDVGVGHTVGTPTATTDANGQAQTTWTLGTTSGAQIVTATVAGMTGSPLVFNATANAGAPASVAVQAGNHQRAVSGTVVAVRPAVIVKDAFNNPTPSVTVTFAAIGGGGSVTGPTQVSNASGIATVGRWTLGSAGPDTLTATVTGSGIAGNPVTFVDTAYALGAPSMVAAVVGNNGVGLAGWAVNVRPAVVVTDANGFAVPGATVTFAATAGGGSGTGLVATTSAQGIAQVGSWVLGGAGLNTLTATVTGSGITGNPVAFTDTGFAAEYQISVRRFGPAFPPQAQAAFDSAVAKWQRIIYRPLNPVSLKVPPSACLPGTPADTEVTTGLVIYAAVDSIDGPGKVLGEAGPCYLRGDSTNLSAYGVMKFDSADVRSLINEGTLNAVILHEMGHVLGFGTLWGPPVAGLIQANCLQLETTLPGGVQDTYFSCPKAQAAFDSVGGTSYTGGGSSPPRGNIVPVENCGTSPYIPQTCGAGTVDSHWREVVMTNELMTGFLNTGSNPLSIVSVAAQEDLGYVVNYAAADPYVHTFTAPPAAGVSRVQLGDDIRHGPMYVVDANGVVLRVIYPR